MAKGLKEGSNSAVAVRRQLWMGMICRGALDPEFCYPARSGSMPDPDYTWISANHLDPAGSGSSRIRIQTCQQQEKNAPQLEETGMTVYPVL